MRRVNEVIVRELHVIPKIENILTELHQAKVFSKIDHREWYCQLLLHKDSQDITSIATHEGLFHYKHLIKGISSAFKLFQKHIEMAIAGSCGLTNIIDDILTWCEDQRHHNKYVYCSMQNWRKWFKN